MKYKIWSNSLQMYTDDPNWPTNERSFSEWIVDQSGNVVEIVTFPPHCFTTVWLDRNHTQSDFRIDIINDE